MKKTIIIFIFVLVFLASIVLAAPPVTQSFVGDIGLQLENPLVSFVQQGRDVAAHLHVYNKSNGFAMNNDTTSCFLHIYNETGHEFFSELYTWASVENEWELNITGGNFSFLGEYGFLAQCNTSSVGGFVRGKFQVTESGEEEPMADATAGIAIVIFILLITGSIFMFSMKEDIFKNKYANLITRRALLVLSIYLMILNSAIMATLAAASNLSLVNEMFFYMNLFGYVGYPAIILLMVSALFQSLNELKIDKKKKREEG